jgi:hypothetical protein
VLRQAAGVCRRRYLSVSCFRVAISAAKMLINTAFPAGFPDVIFSTVT